MAVKVQFEIGHTSKLRSKKSPEGFTHDWEIYVQGVNKADISAFVDKIVFNLHDSFAHPKRVYKEPPYLLKESSYAGFLLAIDIYFRNPHEPRSVQFTYDLDLQTTGPPQQRSDVKEFIFECPSDEFRQKLMKGGGVAVSGVVDGFGSAPTSMPASGDCDMQSVSLRDQIYPVSNLGMAVKVQFEIGHTSRLRSKKTPDGFTHDWEMYVQGVNKAYISAFVDKIVFNLHASFPKPKRVYKEPPYLLKESGYAGFLLPIDIYFRNRDEPRSVQFIYDLDLQTTGPPQHRSYVKEFIFECPSDEFREKLMNGGGVAVSSAVSC